MVSLIYPEFIFSWAIQQRLGAREIAEETGKLIDTDAFNL